MANAPAIERPLRVAVFGTVPEADNAVAKLLEAGFTRDDISVVCSDEAIERHFGMFRKQEPAGTYTPVNALGGSAIGAALGGMAAIAGAVATGGISLLATGGIAAWAGGVVGGLVGAMMTRGVEKELADYYDQAVIAGDILVAVESHDDQGRDRLPLASRILESAGAKPLKLPEA